MNIGKLINIASLSAAGGFFLYVYLEQPKGTSATDDDMPNIFMGYGQVAAGTSGSPSTSNQTNQNQNQDNQQANNQTKGAPGTGPQPWMDTAASQLGVREVGNNRGDIIDQYRRLGGGRVGSEDPWCASFVNWTLESNGIKGTNSAWSQSFRNWGTDAGGPVRGAIVVIDYGNGKGHVGFVHSVNPDGSINVLGGNQSNGVTISRFKTNNVVGYRLPPGYSGGGIIQSNNTSGFETQTR